MPNQLSSSGEQPVMAEIVLVHGIDQQQKSADKLESEWLPALAGGVRVAGFPGIADRIWRDAAKPGAIETRMAFYGYLFLVPGQQGDDPGDWNVGSLEPGVLDHLRCSATPQGALCHRPFGNSSGTAPEWQRTTIFSDEKSPGHLQG
jgi:hypothetical protein